MLSAVGGAGATTVAAHLSTALLLQQRETLAFDWCPENCLRLHFGMAAGDSTGWAASLIAGDKWYTASFRGSHGIDFIPFGILEDERALDRLAGQLKDEPFWFRNQLSILCVPADTIVVCDCPRMPAALRDQVLSVADLVLVVTRPDSVSYATAVHIAQGASQKDLMQTAIVLNGFDSSRQLDRDISLLLRTQHKRLFSPVVVHGDESLREAVASKQTVFDFAPSSQAAYDFSALATWSLARLGHSRAEAG